ncbi:DUF2637 domain-containing protein [Streptacidiphilus sp. N1-12]|uniref:DUF2637 domain-containing protein n=2 Tax=Streptacidiphilus alkalitolerans TaxID=3342712 RepID=A0ABV6V9J4_9ACTN
MAGDRTQPHVNTHPTPVTTPVIWWLGGLAATIILILTGVSLWLSYAHLHDVDVTYGLADDTARSWAWPATLDLFYLAGELLVLLAALRRRIDWWAICITVSGAGASITLNVAGVGNSARPLDYVVAAIPPVASLLAFGALMNQVFRLLTRASTLTPAAVPQTQATDGEAELPTTPVVAPAAPVTAPVHQLPAFPPPPAAAPAIAAPAIAYSDPRCAVIRKLYATGKRPGTKAMGAAIAAAGLVVPSDGTIRGTLRKEVELHEQHLATFPAAI